MYFHINLKKIWEVLKCGKASRRKNKVQKDKTSLISYHSSDFPDIMNKYFYLVEWNLASKMPNPFKQFSESLLQVNSRGSFFFNPISPSEIELEIMTIPQNKAHGLYSFPIHIWGQLYTSLTNPFLCFLILKSIEHT